MSRPTKTNPEYAAMAYQKALLGQCIAHLSSYTSLQGPPQGTIITEDVVREDSEVPEEEILAYVTGLQQDFESIRLEMAKFDFVKREPNVQGKSDKANKAGGESGGQAGRAKAKPHRRRAVRQTQ